MFGEREDVREKHAFLNKGSQSFFQSLFLFHLRSRASAVSKEQPNPCESSISLKIFAICEMTMVARGGVGNRRDKAKEARNCAPLLDAGWAVNTAIHLRRAEISAERRRKRALIPVSPSWRVDRRRCNTFRQW